MLKWTKASQRGGPAECLDIQVQTDKGPRDLRFKCSSAQGVDKLTGILQEKLSAVMEKRKKGKGGFKNAVMNVKNIQALQSAEKKQENKQQMQKQEEERKMQQQQEQRQNSPAAAAAPQGTKSASSSNTRKIPASVVNDAANTKLDIMLVVGPPGVALTKGNTNQILGRYTFSDTLRKCIVDPKDTSSLLLIVKDKAGKDQQLKIKPTEQTAAEVVDIVREYMGPTSDPEKKTAAGDAVAPQTAAGAVRQSPVPAPPLSEQPTSSPAPPPPPPPPASTPPSQTAPTPPPPPPPQQQPPQQQPQQPPPIASSSAAAFAGAAADAMLQERLRTAEARARDAESARSDYEDRANRAASRIAEVESRLRDEQEKHAAALRALEDELAEKAKDLAHAKKIASDLEVELADARRDVEAVMQTTSGATFTAVPSTNAGGSGNDDAGDEVRRMKAFIARMQEGLVERDGRMIRLERKYHEEKAHRQMLEEKLHESMTHNKRMAREIEVRERDMQESFLRGANGGGQYFDVASARKMEAVENATRELAVMSNHDDHLSSVVLRRESIKLAKNECARLEREREELSHMNGKLTLRLGGMETTINRLRQSLKLEDAANQLSMISS